MLKGLETKPLKSSGNRSPYDKDYGFYQIYRYTDQLGKWFDYDPKDPLWGSP
jgi:hypothetical protein